jgi:XTP/dITP diphosphohydrolase
VRSGRREWVIASDNPDKLAELSTLLSGSGLSLEPQSAFGVSAAHEDGSSFLENALIKARHAALQSGYPAIADDSGLCVDALGGAPGLHSSRYAGADATSAQNIVKLLEKLANVSPRRRTAYFYCAMVALREPRDPAPLVAIGRWYGRIALSPSGERGFGYDPIFLVGDSEQTAGQIGSARKNRVSHRGRAARMLCKLLIEDSAATVP